MTDAEWHASDDPEAMVAFLRGRAGGRKLRLFAVACAWRVAASLSDARLSDAATLAERLADGADADAERRVALDTIWGEESERPWVWGLFLNDTDVLRATAGQGVRPAPPGSGPHMAAVMAAESLASDRRDAGAARAWGSAVLRCLFGDPRRATTSVADAVLRWNAGLVPRLARAIYDGRRWGDLPLLADALLDAGCDDEGLLTHCRSGGPHARGCFAVDSLLGLE